MGGWWIGFIVIAALLMVFAPWLTLFPGRFKSKDETDSARLERSESKDDHPHTLKEWVIESKGVGKRLLTSKVYVLNNISSACFIFGILGFATFLPKFIQFHYR